MALYDWLVDPIDQCTKLNLLVLIPFNSMSVAGKDKLSELIARKLMKQIKWMKGKMVRDGVKRRRGEE